MREYVDVKHVSNVSPSKFEKDLKEVIMSYQNEGLGIEIQNGNTTNVFSALVLVYIKRG